MSDNNTYKYGMKLRGFAPMCQPKEGLLYITEDISGKYWNILYYNRQLTDKELLAYELDDLSVEQSVPTFQEELKSLRRKLCMTQEQLASHYGMSKRNIENWESGKSHCPEWAAKLLIEDMKRLSSES